MDQPPSDRRYTKEHEWIMIDGDIATIGITEFAQSELGDITYLELPGAGTALRQSEPFGVVESVKAASDVYAPVSGEVTEGNQAVADDPSVINSDPEGQGWFFKLKLDNPGELDGLMDEAAYHEWLKTL